MEIILRFIGYSQAELEQMEEKEVWRKSFAAMDLVREFMEGITGDGGTTSAAMPPAPPGFDPMAAYTDVGPSLG